MHFSKDWANEDEDIEKNNRIHELEYLVSNITKEIERLEEKITGTRSRSCYSFDAPDRIRELYRLFCYHTKRD